ncbi:NAD(P)H-dependent oxidoreductase [Thorsellia anophelis]|uniref:FMN dependent NADH:quinone oxidoreductase n=1 Tax=Thorsellia anophelis DSM 18579 TaxID=1123402 RepID=A0A1H9ZGR7_9GAMM|nr:NAD(P)H-dependent oxidoreductase [Thorsellia anophelis]SES80860.1 FMN-dependent NADH-azoreductase [Thorsellia anophelis DSM 18579]
MRKVLFLKSSILGGYSQSSHLVDYAVEQWKKSHPNDVITVRDLAVDNLPFLDGELVGMLAPAEGTVLTDRQKSVQATSDALIAQLKDQDVLVLGVAIYNFNISTHLKNYIDLICRAGQTFRYTESGPIGLSGVKEALVLKANGGIYGETHSSIAYLKQVLGFIGIEEINFISAEGMGYGDEVKTKSIADAKAAIDAYLSK